MHTHGINNRLEDKLENYFKLDFLLRPLGVWEPIGMGMVYVCVCVCMTCVWHVKDMRMMGVCMCMIWI
ncbi:hypothetical protein EON63_01370 [archaeon]|nr:MAG: hypothetical protein EON63_01370 [archaeon]